MNELLIKVGKGAALGFGSALVFDLQKWSEQPGASYNWKLAAIRWLKGAVTGAAGALGVSA
jgi:hypothetical protein